MIQSYKTLPNCCVTGYNSNKVFCDHFGQFDHTEHFLSFEWAVTKNKLGGEQQRKMCRFEATRNWEVSKERMQEVKHYGI